MKHAIHKRKSGATLVKTHPGALARRNAIIIALLQGGVGMMPHYNADPRAYAMFAVKVANTIIEETEG